MNNFQNNRFIKTKISNILLEYIGTISDISNSIDFYPISDFILQSLFIKLTGAQEQKFKSMVWEWGCIDLAYRKKIVEYENKNYYSIYKQKEEFLNEIYKAISKNIIILQNVICDDRNKHLCDKFIESTRDSMKRIFIDTNSFYSKTKMFKKYWDNSTGFVNNTELIIKLSNKKLSLFTGEFIYKCYEQLYLYRNKCAHNLFVYQNPHPTLDQLAKRDKNDNIFKWIQTLLIIDEISIYFFEKLENL